MNEESNLPPDWTDFQAEEFPLHRAAREGRIDILKQFVALGAHLNTLTYDRESPLHEACFNGQYECVEYLVDNFTDINARSIDNSTPLCLASAMGHTKCVMLLLERNAQVNPAFVLSTPLHEAVLRHHASCAELLINAGAKLEVSDCDMGRPLHAACFRNSYSCCKLLLHAGANVNAVKNHRTALHIAAVNDYHLLALLLLQFGANIHLKDSFGRTAKQLAPAGSRLIDVLTYWENNPPTLKHLCRITIHEAIKPRHLNVVNELYLPKNLIKFVLSEEVKC